MTRRNTLRMSAYEKTMPTRREEARFQVSSILDPKILDICAHNESAIFTLLTRM